ncbi:DUF2785 domain-containing protein [Paenibacillus lutimineralis]|uniref:DUF2785 domain-containing protein n=1 Tax=Paenibacillus lutimineralis TaxID=2707005 RepID=A0A3S9USQ3_9BACL|nr:DUF2785 domain-containing protein [Paenibacillus lutimineralis]AZS13291.1 DUF2785 domain-containing protein [Paenibacillus lutimineralis]
MNDTRMKLMTDLQRIEKEHYQLREGEQLQDFLTLMLQYIGDPQPELRDDLICTTFYEWFHDENMLTETELHRLLDVLTDEQHLFYQIGSVDDPSVFTRAFSILPIALITERHRKQPFLDQAEYQHLKHSVLRYYKEEKDLRGYLPEGGWAHSAAHGADALEELVQCPESDAALQHEVLAAIQGKLHNGMQIFCEEEDERMATIVDTMIDRSLLPQQEIADWISGLTHCAELPQSRGPRIARVNSKNFLRSLYFRRGKISRGSVLDTAILAGEAKLNRFAIRED